MIIKNIARAALSFFRNRFEIKIINTLKNYKFVCLGIAILIEKSEHTIGYELIIDIFIIRATISCFFVIKKRGTQCKK